MARTPDRRTVAQESSDAPTRVRERDKVRSSKQPFLQVRRLTRERGSLQKTEALAPYTGRACPNPVPKHVCDAFHCHSRGVHHWRSSLRRSLCSLRRRSRHVVQRHESCGAGASHRLSANNSPGRCSDVRHLRHIPRRSRQTYPHTAITTFIDAPDMWSAPAPHRLTVRLSPCPLTPTRPAHLNTAHTAHSRAGTTRHHAATLDTARDPMRHTQPLTQAQPSPQLMHPPRSP